MSIALKPGFQRLATVKLVVNVDELLLRTAVASRGFLAIGDFLVNYAIEITILTYLLILHCHAIMVFACPSIVVQFLPLFSLL